jgi:exodeoxyribonuclease VII large subunit
MPEPQAMTVSQFIDSLNASFAEALFPYGVFVEGEVAQYKVSQGKWIWFDLKDETGLISCFATVWQIKQPLEDGMKVRVHGLPKLYPKNGRFSITVDRVEMVGEGALRRAFELLKKKLEAEGLFAPGRKRPLPPFPERIGLIASTESAAYSDFLRILGNRWGGVEVHSAHVQVQGQAAVTDIVGAFAYFNRHPELADVLVLTRGGGSMEDLHAFNSEEVAHAIFASKVPVVVGIGHERDESLADFVADVRASTPSNAAERLVPDRLDIARRIEAFARSMDHGLSREIAEYEHRLSDFENLLLEHIRSARAEFDAVMSDFERCLLGFDARVQRLAGAVERDERLLKSFDPRGVLRRGYAIVRGPDGKVLRTAADVDSGEAIAVQLSKGSLGATVTATS